MSQNNRSWPRVLSGDLYKSPYGIATLPAVARDEITRIVKSFAKKGAIFSVFWDDIFMNSSWL